MPTQTDNSSRQLHSLYSISEAAEFLGVSIDTLRRWEAKNKITAYRLKGDRYFPLAELQKHQAEEAKPATQEDLCQELPETTVIIAPKPLGTNYVVRWSLLIVVFLVSFFLTNQVSTKIVERRFGPSDMATATQEQGDVAGVSTQAE